MYRPTAHPHSIQWSFLMSDQYNSFPTLEQLEAELKWETEIGDFRLSAGACERHQYGTDSL